MRHLPLIATLLLAALAWASVPFFHGLEHRLPDGDAVGHLGAIELNIMVMEDRGLEEMLRQAFTSGGEYPPLYALVVALASLPFLGDDPFPGGVPIALGGLWALTLLGTALLGRERSRTGPGLKHTSPWAGFLAALILALSPLALALFRQPMPEPMVALFVVYMAWALERSNGFDRALPALLAGLFAAGGLLTKQTFALYALPLGLTAIFQGVIRRTPPGRILGNVSLFSLIAFPLPVYWLMGHLEDQRLYLSASAGSPSTASMLDHLLYYSLVVLGQGLGFGLMILAIGAVIGAVRGRATGGVPRGGWVGAIALLSLIPKKYPRMIVPLLPVLAADLASSAVKAKYRGRGVWSVLVMLGLVVAGAQFLDLAFPAQKASRQTRSVWVPDTVKDLDPHCFQQWIRPPHIWESGMEGIYMRLDQALGARARAMEPPQDQGRVLFMEPIPIECDYQTTFSFPRHLETYIRRRGIDPGLIPTASEELDTADALFEGGWLTLVFTTRPWTCAEVEVPSSADLTYTPPIEERFCQWQPQYLARGVVTSPDPELPYMLYVYERKAEFR